MEVLVIINIITEYELVIELNTFRRLVILK